VDLARAALQFVETLLSYALMLIAMTFNVGLFIAVLLGIALGTFIFARFRPYKRRACC
jgi:copper transporter 1